MDIDEAMLGTGPDGPLSPRHQTGLGMNCLLSPKFRHSGPGLTSPQEYTQWLPYRHDASLLPMKEDLAFWLNTMMGETVAHWFNSVHWDPYITRENVYETCNVTSVISIVSFITITHRYTARLIEFRTFILKDTGEKAAFTLHTHRDTLTFLFSQIPEAASPLEETRVGFQGKGCFLPLYCIVREKIKGVHMPQPVGGGVSGK